MIELSAKEAGRALGAQELAAPVSRVTIDSRQVRDGDLFLALAGENFDGHDFLEDAFRSGAAGAVVSSARFSDLSARGLAADRLYPVEDTVRALGALAGEVRRKSGARVIGITGSVGKTTTKDLIAGMAARRGAVVATSGNYNNEIGVPLTLFELTDQTRTLVVEMGMRGLGEIAELSEVVRPHVGVVTGVAPVHLEILGSLEAVARAKTELLHSLAPGGKAVVPQGSALIEAALEGLDREVVRFAFEEGAPGPADVRGRLLEASGSRAKLEVEWPKGKATVEVEWATPARLRNAVAAAAAVWAAGMPLEEVLGGLAEVGFSGSRGQEIEAGGILVLDDSYNANPIAVEAALEHLIARARELGGRSVAVLGDMLELGPSAPDYHRMTGEGAASLGVELLVAVGPLAEHLLAGYRRKAPAGAGVHVPNPTDAAEEVARIVRPGDVVLVKASRGLRLERVVERLIARNVQTPNGVATRG